MNKIIKIPSNEGGVFTAANNRVSFNIPSGRYYDLSKSYIQLMSSASVIPADASKGVVIPRILYEFDNGSAITNYHRNSVLVKNINFSNQAGSVENIQRSDILSAAFSGYTEDDDMVDSHGYQDLFQVHPTSNAVNSIFADVNREGNSASRQTQRVPVRIKCSDLMNFWNTKQYNSNKYGMGRLEMELNIDKVNIVQALGRLVAGTAPEAFSAANQTEWDQGGQALNQFINCVGSANAPDNRGRDLTKIQVGVGAVPHCFNRLEDNALYYVGQQLLIKATSVNGGTVSDVETNTGIIRTITAIEYNRGEPANAAVPVGMEGAFANNGSLTLTLNQSLFNTNQPAGTLLANGITLSGLVCVGVPVEFNPFQVDFAELILEEVMNPDTSPQANVPINYTSYTTEEFDTVLTKNFQRTFTVEPEAKTLYITAPFYNEANAGLDSTHSFQADISNYRMRIDNKDTSGRFIGLRGAGTNDPLHIQKQITAFINSGKRIKNLLEITRAVGYNINNDGHNYSGNPAANTATLSRFLIGQVLPVTQQQKQIQVILNCPTGKGVKRLVLFKEVNRVI
tara:strand:- start:1003 stop:2706 length:1704 start_codon:yes stop_codon:yes gene_type:complete